MYLSLPTHQKRLQQKQQKQQLQQACLKESTLCHFPPTELPLTSSTSATTTTVSTSLPPTSTTYRSPPPASSMNFLTNERVLEIVDNLEDHWRSPPILTPTTLAVIFNNNNNNNGNIESDDISAQLWSATTTTTAEKNVISTTSLQCFLSQLRETTSHYIPSLEKVIKEDDLLSGILDGDLSISPLCALDHLTQILATFNQTMPATSRNQDRHP